MSTIAPLPDCPKCQGTGKDGSAFCVCLARNDSKIAAQPQPTTGPRPLNKQVPEMTISDECKYCGEGEPEWSPYAKCWIHRRATLDKRCTRKVMGPCGEMPERREGHSVLRCKDGKIERYDPHPAAAPATQPEPTYPFAVLGDKLAEELAAAPVVQPEPNCGTGQWNGKLQDNGTVYDDKTLIQVERGEIEMLRRTMEAYRQRAWVAVSQVSAARLEDQQYLFHVEGALEDQKADLARLREALEDREVLKQAADFLNRMGGGPMEDRLRLLSESIEAALSVAPSETKEKKS